MGLADVEVSAGLLECYAQGSVGTDFYVSGVKHRSLSAFIFGFEVELDAGFSIDDKVGVELALVAVGESFDVYFLACEYVAYLRVEYFLPAIAPKILYPHPCVCFQVPSACFSDLLVEHCQMLPVLMTGLPHLRQTPYCSFSLSLAKYSGCMPTRA